MTAIGSTTIAYQHLRKQELIRQQKFVTILCDEDSTTAMELNEKREVVAFAVAKCNPKDQFCKQQGRVKAAGRLNSSRFRVPLFVPVPLKEFMQNTYHQYQP
jgi:hypothetical protein